MGDEVFRRIRRMNNHIKLVFVMRDPLDRAWSAVYKAHKKGKIEGEISVDKALSRALTPGTLAHSAYADTINRLEAIFPRSQLHFCFFDDLRDRPESFITVLLSFLGAEPSRVWEIQLPEGVKTSVVSKQVPTGFARRMAKEYLPVVQALCDRFEGPPHEWRARYETLLNGSGE